MSSLQLQIKMNIVVLELLQRYIIQGRFNKNTLSVIVVNDTTDAVK